MLITYDVTNENSFYSVTKWLEMIKEVKPDIPRGVIANKCDLPAVVKSEDARRLCADLGMEFHEASAFSGVGVDEAYMSFANIVFEEWKPDQKMRDTVIIQRAEAPKVEKKRSSCVL